MGYRAENINQYVKKMADLRRIAAFFSFFGPQPDSSIKFAGDYIQGFVFIFNPSIEICFLVSDIREMQASWKGGTVGISLISS